MAEEREATRKNWTIKALLEWTAGYLAEKGVRTPRLDAEVLLASVLGVDRLYLYLNMDRPTAATERTKYREAVLRRARREPTALITGEKEFWSFPFKVARGVLIPRPDTETLVECVLRHIGGHDQPRVLELGVGSGVVSVSILRENPGATVLGTDISGLALYLARENAARAGVASRLSLLASDMFEALRSGPHFDVICSNPPYVPTADIDMLEPEVSRFEPTWVLDGGPDGLDAIRKIACKAGDFLKPTGVIILEVGAGQAREVSRLLHVLAGCKETAIYKDLAGKERVVEGHI